DRRRWPRAIRLCATTPSESGPRDSMAHVIRVTAATSAELPSKQISPHIPHIRLRFLQARCELRAGSRSGLAVSNQVSLLPPPDDELTIRDPRVATRVSPACITCAVTESPGPGRR